MKRTKQRRNEPALIPPHGWPFWQPYLPRQSTTPPRPCTLCPLYVQCRPDAIKWASHYHQIAFSSCSTEGSRWLLEERASSKDTADILYGPSTFLQPPSPRAVASLFLTCEADPHPVWPNTAARAVVSPARPATRANRCYCKFLD